MKKLLYITLIAFSSALAITACTEEEGVSPSNSTTTSTSNGGNAILE